MIAGCLALLALAAGGPAGHARAGEGAAPLQEGQHRPARPFGEVVRACFAGWDADGDGRLSGREVDRLMPRREITGEAAAALAVIKLREREEDPKDRARFARTLDELAGPRALAEEVGSVDSARDGRHPFNYEAHYRRNLGVLATMNRTLYAGRGPSFAAMKQGEIGDCYFFCLTGALAARDPDRIVRMIRPLPEGGYSVQFLDGEAVRVPAPTEAEVLVNNSASSLRDGLWLPVLELALGAMMYGDASASRRTAEVSDAMASGGSISPIIRLYSGHRDLGIRLRQPRFAADRLAELRELLPEVLGRGMLAGVTLDEDPPGGGRRVPGLGYRHGYAILAYDARTDVVTLWNPWGQDFRPDGPDGVEHGFTADHGVFRIPLPTLYDQFSTVHLETYTRASALR